MEKGIVTDFTKERLEKLEKRKNELATNIVIEKAKNKLIFARGQIWGFLPKIRQK
jgi:hypothetical protein